MTGDGLTEPYDVDLTDAMLRGRMRNAAAHGDQRARLTLRNYDRDAAAARAAAQAKRAAHGRSVADVMAELRRAREDSTT